LCTSSDCIANTQGLVKDVYILELICDQRVEALNRFEEFRSALARYVVHYIVYASSVCSHLRLGW
jgi:hypothetical protein